MNYPEKAQADENFSRARAKEVLSRLGHLFYGGENTLLSFGDIKDLLKPKNESYRGMQTVPINLIAGSEGRYRDFTKYFLPRYEHLRERWTRVDEARIKDIVLPPVKLYEIGGIYFVRDGNHRVSVARSQGGEMIDAEVTSLSSEIPLSPDMTTEDLKKKLLEYEKKHFYEKTGFGEITGDFDLDLSSTGRYDTVYRHILEHKYYINQGKDDEISFEEAALSWYRNVYLPVIEIIRAEKLARNFPDRTEGDLYVWLSGHWDILKKQYGVYSLDEAARDFRARYGEKGGFRAWLSALFKKPPPR